VVLEAMGAEEILALCLHEFPGKVSLACSFQKEEAVLLDMLLTLDPAARVFAIDTHHLFPETYELWREVEQRYQTKVEVFAGPSPTELAATHGEELWEHKPDLYLSIAKVEPLVRALGGLDAWITGVRREQSVTRADAQFEAPVRQQVHGRRLFSHGGGMPEVVVEHERAHS